MTAVWSERMKIWEEALKKYRYIWLVIAAGVVLLMLPSAKYDGEEAPAAEETQAESFRLEEFETHLEDVLSRVEGAGKARVVLTLSEGSRQILAQDRKQSGAQEGSATTVTLGKGSGNQEVVPVQTLAPEFRGALVVCPGGGDPGVQLRLLEAVSALTGLGADRISICQGNQ